MGFYELEKSEQIRLYVELRELILKIHNLEGNKVMNEIEVKSKHMEVLDTCYELKTLIIPHIPLNKLLSGKYNKEIEVKFKEYVDMSENEHEKNLRLNRYNDYLKFIKNEEITNKEYFIIELLCNEFYEYVVVFEYLKEQEQLEAKKDEKLNSLYYLAKKNNNLEENNN